MEKKPLSVELFDEAKNNIKGKMFLVGNPEKKIFKSFKANSIIIENTETQPIVTVHGKELSVEKNVALTLTQHYEIHEDFSFGVWEMADENPKAHDLILECLSEDGSIDLGFNDCELADFKK